MAEKTKNNIIKLEVGIEFTLPGRFCNHGILKLDFDLNLLPEGKGTESITTKLIEEYYSLELTGKLHPSYDDFSVYYFKIK